MSEMIWVTLSSRFLLTGIDVFCATCLNMFVTVARLVLDRSSVLFASDNTMFSPITELSTLSADNTTYKVKVCLFEQHNTTEINTVLVLVKPVLTFLCMQSLWVISV